MLKVSTRELENEVVEVSREVVQSYILTTARRDWGVYAEKFLLRLVELAQNDVEGLKFKGGRDMKPHTPSLNYPSVQYNAAGDAIVSIPLRSLLPSEDYTNYRYIEEAVEQLQTKILKWEDVKKDRQGRVVYEDGVPVRKWTRVQLIGRTEGEMSSNGLIVARIDVDIWRAMMDFSKGFRAFDLKVALKLQSRYSLRLYQLLSRQEYPLTYNISDLKVQWGIEDKYPRAVDFEKRVIIPAKEELDGISPYTFTYKMNKSKTVGKGRKPVESITFYPVHQIRFEKPKTLAGFDETQMLDPILRQYLKNRFSFEWVEIERTFEILYTAQKTMTGADEKHPSIINFLSGISRAADMAQHPKRYVIGALKTHLKEVYGLVIKTRKEKDAEKKALKKASAKVSDDGASLLGDVLTGK